MTATCADCGETSEFPKSDGVVCSGCGKWICDECNRLRTDCPACGTEFEVTWEEEAWL